MKTNNQSLNSVEQYPPGFIEEVPEAMVEQWLAWSRAEAEVRDALAALDWARASASCARRSYVASAAKLARNTRPQPLG